MLGLKLNHVIKRGHWAADKFTLLYRLVKSKSETSFYSSVLSWYKDLIKPPPPPYTKFIVLWRLGCKGWGNNEGIYLTHAIAYP